ncbi:GNAT family N-acetyltransferase [Streptomyces canus]
MIELGPVAWLPAPIRTERLVLRESEARDRAALIELFASPEVGTYLGGPRPRDELEGAVPEVPGQRPGFFVVELDGAMIGIVTLDRRGAERPGHVRPEGGEAELGYMFLLLACMGMGRQRKGMPALSHGGAGIPVSGQFVTRKVASLRAVAVVIGSSRSS